MGMAIAERRLGHGHVVGWNEDAFMNPFGRQEVYLK